MHRCAAERTGHAGTHAALSAAAAGLVALLWACSGTERPETGAKAPELAVIDHARRQRPPFSFSAADGELLEAVQHGAFNYLWGAVDPVTGMVFDRTSVRVISVAGVGFQLSAIPVAVERGWITREQGRERAERILGALQREPLNRKAGLFFHYLEEGTAKPTTKAYETVVSTIDSALLFAGMMTASSYFGGEVARTADAMLAEADWRFFVAENPKEPWARGFITLGWRPSDTSKPTGEGSLLPYYWADAGDEQKLVTFLACGALDASKRVPPETYYRMRRRLGSYADSGPFVWFPWSGALFTHFFAHCWIDYAHLAPDSPASFGIANRPRVDWWENSRRAVLMHRRKAVENPLGLPTFGPDAWGLGAHDAASGYVVNHLFPAAIDWPGAQEGIDYAEFAVKDEWGDGTVAPYNAGCAIMFDPQAAVAALRHSFGLKNASGAPLVWRDPGAGGFGFQDAYNSGTGWVAPDCVAIDQGPLVVAIENARTGLVWGQFQRHPVAKTAFRSLSLRSAGGNLGK